MEGIITNNKSVGATSHPAAANDRQTVVEITIQFYWECVCFIDFQRPEMAKQPV